MSERTLFDYDGPAISKKYGCEPSIKKLIKLYYRAYGIVGLEAENLVEQYIKGWLLLHGEKEQPKRTDSLRRARRDCCDCVHEKEIGTLSCHGCFYDPARPNWEMKEQPDEWEEWIQRMPNPHYFRIGDDIAWNVVCGNLQDWFRSIPCNPRRKP